MHQDSRRYIVAGVILLIGAGLTQAAQSLRGADSVCRPDFAAVPMQVGEYKGERLDRDESVFNYLEAKDMEVRIYRGPDRTISLTMIFGTDWRSIHAPTGCYPAQGWTMVENKAIKIPPPESHPHEDPIEARAVYATKNDRREVALFVYARPGATTSDWTSHGWHVATGQRGAGGMIITLRTTPKTDELDQEIAPLAELLRATYPAAVAFWSPKKAS